MINFKKVSKESVGKSRSKSIYRGNQSHTLSMNIRMDNDFSQDNIQNANKDMRYGYKLEKRQCQKQNKVNKQRSQLKMMEGSSGKKTTREEVSKSIKKLIDNKALQSERFIKEGNNLSSRKGILIKKDRIQMYTQFQENKSISTLYPQKMAVNQQQLKQILRKMKSMKEENDQIKKQLQFYKKQECKNSISRVLRN